MKNRTALIGTFLSLLPLGQPLVVGTGAVFTSSAVILSTPEKARAESADFYFNRGLNKENAGDYSGANAREFTHKFLGVGSDSNDSI